MIDPLLQPFEAALGVAASDFNAYARAHHSRG